MRGILEKGSSVLHPGGCSTGCIGIDEVATRMDMQTVGVKALKNRLSEFLPRRMPLAPRDELMKELEVDRAGR